MFIIKKLIMRIAGKLSGFFNILSFELLGKELEEIIY